MTDYQPPAPVKETANATVVIAPLKDKTMDSIVVPSTAAQKTTHTTSPSTIGSWANIRQKMPTKATDAHVHVYNNIAGRNVGNGKTILYRVCECSKEKAFELLPRDAARELYLRIKGAKQ